MKIPAQQNGNPLAACYCSQLEKALSEVNYAKPLKRQFLSQMQDSLYSYLEAHPDARLEDLYAAFGTPQEAADSALLNTDSAQIKKQLKTSQLFHFCLRSLSPSLSWSWFTGWAHSPSTAMSASRILLKALPP